MTTANADADSARRFRDIRDTRVRFLREPREEESFSPLSAAQRRDDARRDSRRDARGGPRGSGGSLGARSLAGDAGRGCPPGGAVDETQASGCRRTLRRPRRAVRAQVLHGVAWGSGRGDAGRHGRRGPGVLGVLLREAVRERGGASRSGGRRRAARTVEVVRRKKRCASATRRRRPRALVDALAVLRLVPRDRHRGRRLPRARARGARAGPTEEGRPSQAGKRRRRRRRRQRRRRRRAGKRRRVSVRPSVRPRAPQRRGGAREDRGVVREQREVVSFPEKRTRKTK